MPDADPAGPARTSPSVARNRDAILAILEQHLPPTGLVLEIASGTGEHAMHFATALPHLEWQPTDPDPAARASIEAWREAAGPGNLLAPLALDAAAPDSWPVDRAQAVVAINMIHIAPWRATEGLFAGAAAILQAGGTLLTYGPYRESGAFTGGNAAFDMDLRARNPEWGVRDIEGVTEVARQNGLRRTHRITMPANNLTLVFRRV